MADCVRHGGGTSKGPVTVATAQNNRITAWSTQLGQAHDTLRHQLQQLQENLDDPDAGHPELITHCLAFCSALTTHHVGEDDGMFVDLLRARPDLEPVIANLVQDHRMIATIVASGRDLATEAGGATTERRKAIGRELNGLAAIVESHFSYEERAISDALDGGVPDTGWSKTVLKFEA